MYFSDIDLEFERTDGSLRTVLVIGTAHDVIWRTLMNFYKACLMELFRRLVEFAFETRFRLLYTKTTMLLLHSPFNCCIPYGAMNLYFMC